MPSSTKKNSSTDNNSSSQKSTRVTLVDSGKGSKKNDRPVTVPDGRYWLEANRDSAWIRAVETDDSESAKRKAVLKLNGKQPFTMKTDDDVKTEASLKSRVMVTISDGSHPCTQEE